LSGVYGSALTCVTPGCEARAGAAAAAAMVSVAASSAVPHQAFRETGGSRHRPPAFDLRGRASMCVGLSLLLIMVLLLMDREQRLAPQRSLRGLPSDVGRSASACRVPSPFAAAAP
jgi:hypothetical protein